MVDDETNVWPNVKPNWGYRRPPENDPANAIREASIGGQYGWRLPIIWGEQAVGRMHGSGAFTLLGPQTSKSNHPSAIDHLILAQWDRFGSAVRQLRNAFFVAERYGAKRIEFPSSNPLLSGDSVKGIELTWQPSSAVNKGLGLRGSFYYLQGLNLQLTSEDIARMIRTYVRPLVSPAVAERRGDLKPGDLVLHFRAGDIFDTDPQRVHPFYGQPPLAYYLAAVEREKPSRVWLVYEDRGNPCIAAVETLLKGRGIEVVLQSGSLVEDVHLLLSATRIVAGLGAFVPGVAALSIRLQKLYLFRPPIVALQHLGVTLIEGLDTAGHYRERVLSGNWRALPEQRALMLSYPARAIGFMEHPALA
jgi:hypothetical protein